MIEVTIADVADLIRGMVPEERRALADDLARSPSAPPRCPSVDVDTKARCVRDEDHVVPHVGANGAEWLVALRCRIGAGDGGAVCSRLDKHEGDCKPLPPRAPVPAPELAQPTKKEGRGVCTCGAARQEHDGPTKTGGCARTGCKRYTSGTR